MKPSVSWSFTLVVRKSEQLLEGFRGEASAAPSNPAGAPHGGGRHPPGGEQHQSIHPSPSHISGPRFSSHGFDLSLTTSLS